MKHGVVVASPRAGITRDKYSANKSSRASPVTVTVAAAALPRVPPPVSARYLQSRARGGRSARPPPIFNKSSRVAHQRWPPWSVRGRPGAKRSLDVIRLAFYFVPRARGRGRWSSLSSSSSVPLFLSFAIFFALVLRHRSTFSPFLVDAGLLGNYQSGSSDRKYPAHPPPFATCVRGVPADPAGCPPLIPANLPPSPGPGYPPPPPPPPPYVH